MAGEIAPLTANERAAIRTAEHDCDCAVCDDLVARYEGTLEAAEAERDQQTALVRQWDERDHAKTVRIAELERERDAARSALEEHRIAYTALTGERDRQRGPCEVCWTVSWAPTPDGEHCAHCDLVTALRATATACAAAEQRATRLVALEQAARALVEAGHTCAAACVFCDPLEQAVDALAAPPGEPA